MGEQTFLNCEMLRCKNFEKNVSTQFRHETEILRKSKFFKGEKKKKKKNAKKMKNCSRKKLKMMEFLEKNC